MSGMLGSRWGRNLGIVAIVVACLNTPGNRAMANDDDAGANRPVRDKWALVVGIGTFADPRFNLKYSAKDARDFADYLVNEAGFAKDHVKVILNQDATYRRIRSELGNKWLPRVANPDDLVVLYFSTHGSGADLDVGGDNYLVASDTDVNDLYATGLSMRTLASDIKQRVHCDRVVIFLDACHSGGLTAAGTGAKGLFRSGVDAQEFSAGSGQMVIASSKDNQASWESKKLANGVFTSSLLQVLRNQGANASIGSVFSALKDQVQDTVLRERGVLQTPVLSSQWKGNELRLAAEPTSRHPGLADDETGSLSTLASASKAAVPDAMVPPETIAAVTNPVPAVSTPVPHATTPSTHATPPAAAAQVPAGPPTSRTLLVPGVSVGRINLGMSKTEVMEMLGKPASTSGDTVTYWAGKSYFLCLKFAGNNLSQVAFSSPFFRTQDSVGLASLAVNQGKFKQVEVDPQFLVRTFKGGGFSVVSPKSDSHAVVALLHKGDMEPASLSWIPAARAGTATTGSAQSPAPASAASSSTAPPSAAPVSSSTLVTPGASIAKARLGMSRADVLSLLGKPNAGEKNGVLAYFNGTGAKRYFLAVRIVAGVVTDIAYSSPAFATASGIKVSTFQNRLSEFAAPTKDTSGTASIYTLKNGGGLSMVDRGGAPRSFGWLHAPGVDSNSIDWVP